MNWNTHRIKLAKWTGKHTHTHTQKHKTWKLEWTEQVKMLRMK